MNQYVAEVLKRHQAMDAEELDAAVAKADDGGFELVDVLRATDAIEETVLVKALAAEMGMEFVEKIDSDATPDDVVEAVPINFARQHHIVPIGERDDEIIVAVSNPLDPFPLDDLRALLGRPIDAVASTRESIDDAINRVYERKEEASLAEAKEGADEVEELQDIIDQTDEAPVIKWVNDLFYKAVNERVSDIHIEPTDEKVIVRFRIAGRLVKRKEAHKGNLSSIVARVKIEA
ncbi:MAG: GspE/PulE family protein, partial [Polyangiales bacterium]